MCLEVFLDRRLLCVYSYKKAAREAVRKKAGNGPAAREGDACFMDSDSDEATAGDNQTVLKKHSLTGCTGRGRPCFFALFSGQ